MFFLEIYQEIRIYIVLTKGGNMKKLFQAIGLVLLFLLVFLVFVPKAYVYAFIHAIHQFPLLSAYEQRVWVIEICAVIVGSAFLVWWFCFKKKHNAQKTFSTH